MTVHVTLEEAQAKLAELLVRVRDGEEVIIDQDGAAVAVLSPPTPPVATGGPPGPLSGEEPRRPKRKLGAWDHLNLDIDPDIFLERDPELEALMDKPIWPE